MPTPNARMLDKVNDSDYRLAVYVTVPNSNNTAGVNYRSAIINTGIGGKTALLTGAGTDGTITAAEVTAITAGSLYEEVVTLRISTYPGAFGSAGWLAALDADIARIQTEVIARLQVRLAFAGGSR